MAPPTILPLYAGLLGILFLALSVNVIRLRRRLRISLGDGGGQHLARQIRAHGNFVDYVPLVLALLLLAELGGTRPWLMHLLAASLLAGRLLHAWCFVFAGGAAGLWVAAMTLTFIALGGSALTLLAVAIQIRP